MPYNSAAFEKQLAKFKKQQAGKPAEEKAEDPHVAKSRVEIGRGAVMPNTVAEPAAPLPDAHASKAEDTEPAVIIVEAPKKPFYKQGWFTFLLFSVVISGAMPVVFKSQMESMMGMADMVSENTGVDVFSADTYKKMATGQPLTPNAKKHDSGTTADGAEEQESSIKKIVKKVSKDVVASKKVPADTSTESRISSGNIQTSSDIHDMVDLATQKASEVSAQGPEQSMKYIEEESRRLQEMAKQFDDTYGAKKQ